MMNAAHGKKLLYHIFFQKYEVILVFVFTFA